jgi:hypothetical protein
MKDTAQNFHDYLINHLDATRGDSSQREDIKWFLAEMLHLFSMRVDIQITKEELESKKNE